MFNKLALCKKLGRYKVSAKEDRTYDGIVFDSKWEANTYKLLQTHKKPNVYIHKQVEFLLQPKFKDAEGKAIREINYIADFVLSEKDCLEPNTLNSGDVVIDSKGHLTDIFKLKNKLFIYKYNTVIHQVKRPSDVIDTLNKFNYCNS